MAVLRPAPVPRGVFWRLRGAHTSFFFSQMLLLVLAATIMLCAGQAPRSTVQLATSPLSVSVLRNYSSTLEGEFKEAGLVWGGPLYLRATKYSNAKFKLYRDGMLGLRGPQVQIDSRNRFLNGYWYTEASLEVWGTRQDGQGLDLFKSYAVCTYSGKLGPKRKEGDAVTPEGFYTVVPAAFNPRSAYRLSFNLGYPNRYDKIKQRTGGSVMVHGYCASIGCLAMNEWIDEIYTIVSTSASRGQTAIPIHVVPFPLTKENLDLAVSVWPDNMDFWTNELAPAWQAFQAAEVKQVPVVDIDTSSGTPVYKLRQ